MHSFHRLDQVRGSHRSCEVTSADYVANSHSMFLLLLRHLQADSWKIISAADDKTLKVTKGVIFILWVLLFSLLFLLRLLSQYILLHNSLDRNHLSNKNCPQAVTMLPRLDWLKNKNKKKHLNCNHTASCIHVAQFQFSVSMQIKFGRWRGLNPLTLPPWIRPSALIKTTLAYPTPVYPKALLSHGSDCLN